MLVGFLLFAASADRHGALASSSAPTATGTVPPCSASPTPRQWGVIFGSAGVAAAVMLLLGVIAVYVSTRNALGEYEEIQRISAEQPKW
jgi:hypothetical protein